MAAATYGKQPFELEKGNGCDHIDCHTRGHEATNTAVWVVSGTLYGCLLVWSYFYNWARTGSKMLGLMLDFDFQSPLNMF
jgi:hypothetical protein